MSHMMNAAKRTTVSLRKRPYPPKNKPDPNNKTQTREPAPTDVGMKRTKWLKKYGRAMTYMIAKTRTHFFILLTPIAHRLPSRLTKLHRCPSGMSSKCELNGISPIMHVFLRIKKEVPLGETSFPY